MIRRRDLILLTGGAAAAWPLVARTQQKAMPVIGYLGPTSPEQEGSSLRAIREGLSAASYIEGRNVTIEYLFAEGQNDRLPALAAELVARKVDVVLTGGIPAIRAAMKATSTIPIVFVTGVDPVAAGLVSNLARPDGNLTGLTVFGPALNPKRFELLSELIPEARVIAQLINPTNPASVSRVEELTGNIYELARAKGVQMHLVKAGNASEIDAAFAMLAELQAGGLIVGAEPFFYKSHDQIVALAARYRVPAVYDHRMYTDAGGLISYGAKAEDMVRTAGVYAGRILAGAKPADLPVQQPAKFETIINLKAAKALGLAVPPSLLARADEVIE